MLSDLIVPICRGVQAGLLMLSLQVSALHAEETAAGQELPGAVSEQQRAVEPGIGEPGAPGEGREVRAPLPEPLTLEYALSLAEDQHPDLLTARSDLELLRAAQLDAEAQYGVNVTLKGRARWIEPSSTASSREHDDNHVGLFVDKRLYDFGRERALQEATAADLEGEELRYASAPNQRRIDIMEAYFNVLLADLEFARDNEDMAVVYVTLDRVRDRHEQGLVSDIELSRQESEYQQSRIRRYTSEVNQRIARSRLAMALNRPGMLSSSLIVPQLPINKRERGELEVLEKMVLQDNPELNALRKQLQAAQSYLQAARAEYRPVITGELEASDYSRELGSSDELRAGLHFQVPLYKGGAVKAAVARRHAEFNRLQADVARAEMRLRQSVLELWQQLYVLQAQREEASALADYRDLYLDLSRGLYELDVKTDLGDAMVEFSKARLRQAETEYALALVWVRLDALAGRPVAPDALPTVAPMQVED